MAAQFYKIVRSLGLDTSIREYAAIAEPWRYAAIAEPWSLCIFMLSLTYPKLWQWKQHFGKRLHEKDSSKGYAKMVVIVKYI